VTPSGVVSERCRRALPLGSEDGFSLVELSVVGAVIGLLLSFGIGTFTGASGKAQERAVQHDLRTGLDAALILALDGGGRFVVGERPVGPADLHEVEPALTFADSGDRDVIGVSVTDDEMTIRLDELDDRGRRHTLVAVSGSGMRFCVDVEPEDCAFTVPTSTTETTETTVGASSGGGGGNGGGSNGRQDGTTPAADRRQNGR